MTIEAKVDIALNQLYMSILVTYKYTEWWHDIVICIASMGSLLNDVKSLSVYLVCLFKLSDMTICCLVLLFSTSFIRIACYL